MQVIVQKTTHCVRALLRASLESYILVTQKQPIDCKKQQSTSTSESQNEEEVG